MDNFYLNVFIEMIEKVDWNNIESFIDRIQDITNQLNLYDTTLLKTSTINNQQYIYLDNDEVITLVRSATYHTLNGKNVSEMSIEDLLKNAPTDLLDKCEDQLKKDFAQFHEAVINQIHQYGLDEYGEKLKYGWLIELSESLNANYQNLRYKFLTDEQWDQIYNHYSDQIDIYITFLDTLDNFRVVYLGCLYHNIREFYLAYTDKYLHRLGAKDDQQVILTEIYKELNNATYFANLRPYINNSISDCYSLNYRAIYKGAVGEARVMDYLNRYLPFVKKYQGIRLPIVNQDYFSENDFLLVTNKGIFTVEVKNKAYKELIVEDTGKTIEVYPGTTEISSDNVIEQCNRHAIDLINLLSYNKILPFNRAQTTVKGICLITNEKTKVFNESHTPIIKLNTELINLINTSPDYFTDDEVNEICKFLESQMVPAQKYPYRATSNMITTPVVIDLYGIAVLQEDLQRIQSLNYLRTDYLEYSKQLPEHKIRKHNLFQYIIYAILIVIISIPLLNIKINHDVKNMSMRKRSGLKVEQLYTTVDYRKGVSYSHDIMESIAIYPIFNIFGQREGERYLEGRFNDFPYDETRQIYYSLNDMIHISIPKVNSGKTEITVVDEKADEVYKLITVYNQYVNHNYLGEDRDYEYLKIIAEPTTLHQLTLLEEAQCILNELQVYHCINLDGEDYLMGYDLASPVSQYITIDESEKTAHFNDPEFNLEITIENLGSEKDRKITVYDMNKDKIEVVNMEVSNVEE